MGADSRGGAGLLPDRHPTGDFFVCDIFGASPKDDLGSMEHPIFSLSTRPDRRILSYAHNGIEVQVTPSVRGRATIHDKDILIYCISQLMAAMNAGRAISRTLHLKAHDLLVATNRDTSGDGYTRLREAFERLAGTRITTNLSAGGEETTRGFGLIEEWEIKRKSRGGRMVSVVVTLSEWLFRAVLAKSVLTLSRDYFRLRKPLERRVYELARKHCGRQPDWRVSVTVLHKKTGSAAPLRVFRAAIRRMIADDHLPDYRLVEEEGDLVRVTRRGSARRPDAPHVGAETLDAARRLAPGMDIYGLVAEWQGWWAETGRARLSDPDKAFLGWLRSRMTPKG
ncbi:replication initiator protein A [Lutimaribacter sp. EGI FJ00015]|uniref:Replication initiator protein A n=1 Tax=Lutimaribacter degradans TaxID=2945989 RepID=A0ACC6A0Z0_9RHOB|nr:replication initiator protein A [Lutimaribacter sp. EGI FJ00013]MCM2563853.1 replication initiator protein A [Lutimaribacter sp. EGI FJ00013]MCO0615048.1 replication initiator protein A [Lutimaribacter sp. EGI FJ00015]MCO0637720.1 replication initiator protein A [Lutimaribacter sp. EGI FJ00014]